MNVTELLAALPDDEAQPTLDSEWARARLREILADLASRPGAGQLSAQALDGLGRSRRKSLWLYLAWWVRQ